MRSCLLLFVSFALAQPPAARRIADGASWKMVYNHDEDRSSLNILDIKMGSPTCIAAVGLLHSLGRSRPMSLVSEDGGGNWTQVPLKDTPRSLFFLDARHGWLVTDKGLQTSADCGKTWTPLAKVDGAIRVHFPDADHGYLMGVPKKVMESLDGGRSWKKLPAADASKASPNRTAFMWAEFDKNGFGMIGGFHQPDRHQASFPPWMDPEGAKSLRQWPALSLMLQTLDGGKSWKLTESSLFGKMTRMAMGPRGRGFALVEFDDTFEWPSELYLVDATRNSIDRAYREKDRALTDVAVLSSGIAYAAGFEPTGGSVRLPIPGKVRILRSLDLATWQEMEVDYRATARRVILATWGSGPVAVATDSGSILMLRASAR